MLNADVTAARLSECFTSVLEAATPDDIVVLSFSGHGTEDFALVAHDTRQPDLTRTTVPMQELAVAFRDSKARGVLAILDCCHSGGGAAKVLHTDAAPRSALAPHDSLQGKGRVLIAATCKSSGSRPCLWLPVPVPSLHRGPGRGGSCPRR